MFHAENEKCLLSRKDGEGEKGKFDDSEVFQSSRKLSGSILS
jgi:hypothetical protein